MAPRGAPGRREAFPNAQRALVLALEIGDDIGALAVIRDAGEAHGRAPEITQGKFEEAVQSLPVLDDAGGSDGVGIDLVGGWVPARLPTTAHRLGPKAAGSHWRSGTISRTR